MSWAEIKKAIKSNISKSIDVLITEKSNELSTSIGNNNSLLNNSTYGLSALQSIISNVKSLLENTIYGLKAIKDTVNSVNNTVSVVGNIPSVKSVQRGTSSVVSGSTSITISSVNTSKSIVIIQGGGSIKIVTGDNVIDDRHYYSCVYGVLNSTSISLYSSGENRCVCSWQVIEFY